MECGVGVLETVNSNSGLFSSFRPVLCEEGDVGDTTSSCHVFFGVVILYLGFMGPVGVTIVVEAGTEDWAMFWKTCIGRASKNSWASIKGINVSSISMSAYFRST